MRVSLSTGGAPWVFGGFGGATSWRHLVDDDGAAGRSIGGHVEVGEDSRLLRWCVRPGADASDPETVLPLAGRVPLPFEKLWLVAARSDAVFGGVPADRRRATSELEACGRLQVVSDDYVVVKAATVSADAYAAAKAKVRSFARARDARRAASFRPSPSESERTVLLIRPSARRASRRTTRRSATRARRTRAPSATSSSTTRRTSAATRSGARAATSASSTSASRGTRRGSASSTTGRPARGRRSRASRPTSSTRSLTSSR